MTALVIVLGSALLVANLALAAHPRMPPFIRVWNLMGAAILTFALLTTTAKAGISLEEIRISKRIAADHWGVEDRCPPSTVSVDWVKFPNNALGYSIIDGCRNGNRWIQLNTRQRTNLRDEEWCSVIVHEYGHLAGKGHSKNPDSIMYYQYNDFWRCINRFT